MAKLTELSYADVTSRLKTFGFRFYRHGKGSHELWVRESDGKVVPIPNHKSKPIRKGMLRAILREIEVSVNDFFTMK